VSQKAEILPANNLDSIESAPEPILADPPSGWFRLGMVAAASAFAGGLAAAWWYRKTLTKLRESEELTENPQNGISDDLPSDREPPFEI
jgi:hypothetical protein